MHYADEQLSAMLENEDGDPSSPAFAHLEKCEVCRARTWRQWRVTANG